MCGALNKPRSLPDPSLCRGYSRRRDSDGSGMELPVVHRSHASYNQRITKLEETEIRE